MLAVRASPHRRLPFVSEIDPTEFSTTVVQKQSEREGLPPSYRMRADAHYVDQLTRRADRGSVDSGRDQARDGGRGAGKDTVRDAGAAEGREAREGRDRADRPERADRADKTDRRDRASDALWRQLAETVRTIDATVGLLSSDSSAMARRVSLDLLRSQSARAGWIVQAEALVSQAPASSVRSRRLASLLIGIADGFAAECRLCGIALTVDPPDWNVAVPIDEAALTTGVRGALFATFSLLEGVEGAAVRLSAAAGSGDVRIEIHQDAAAIAPSLSARFFEAGWTDRPGGPFAALAAAAARQASRLHGGDASLIPLERRGGTLRLELARPA
jgi:hypothetical protein